MTLHAGHYHLSLASWHAAVKLCDPALKTEMGYQHLGLIPLLLVGRLASSGGNPLSVARAGLWTFSGIRVVEAGMMRAGAWGGG